MSQGDFTMIMTLLNEMVSEGQTEVQGQPPVGEKLPITDVAKPIEGKNNRGQYLSASR